MRNWHIMNARGTKEPVPFTEAQLLQAKVLKGFRYREVWPLMRWEIKEINDREQFVDLSRKYSDIRGMHDRFCKQGEVTCDNHQTFLVAINGRVYFVIFHDGGIWIGTEGRTGDVSY